MTTAAATDSAPPTPRDPADLVHCLAAARTYGSGSTAVVAVHGVTCTVHPGMRLALTGPSGSGKSTLLHLMAGLERPSAGSVRWPALGDDPTGRPGLVGVVFQGPSLLPPLDVAENVALPLVLAGQSPAAARDVALAALERLNVQDLADRLPEELSGGQAQRVAIARVLAGRPALILADEPTGQLDGATAAHVIDVLLQAADDLGSALVVSTHDPAVAERLTQRWQLRDGTLLPTGSTSEGARP